MAALFKGVPGAFRLRRRGALAGNWRAMEELLLNWERVLKEDEEAVGSEKYPYGVIEV